MRRKCCLCALLAALFLLTLGGCGEEAPIAPTPTPTPVPTAAPEPEPVEFALPCYPEHSFHPVTSDNRTNLNLGGLLYEGLFALDQRFEPHPVLCQDYSTSEDGRTWTFTLRPEVTFSDGSPVTAALVAGALEEARNSPLYSARLAQVASIRAGQGAVTITLKTPNGALPALLDVPISKGGGDRPLGTGPYVLLEQEDELVLRVRSDWRQGTGALPRQEIPLCAVRGAEELMQAFDTHSAALVATDLTGGGTVGFSGSFETMDYPTSTMVFVGINTRRGPCRDTVLCQALQRLADRQTMAEVLLARHGVPAALPAAPGCGLYPEGLAGELEFSLRTAEELLTGGGWLPGEDGVRQKGRERLELTLVVSEDNLQRVSLAERLAEDLKQAGISVTLRKLSWERYLAALAQGNFDLYLGEVRMTADFDPAALIAPGGSLNYGGYSDGEAQRLLTAFQGAAGPARREAAEALYLRLTEVPPFVVLCFKNGSVLTQWRQISGLTPTQQNIFYEFTQWNIA